MAYTKQLWANGDIITAAKMNHMEDGIDAISANGAIGTTNLANGAVTLAKLADAVKSHFALADDVDEVKSQMDNIDAEVRIVTNLIETSAYTDDSYYVNGYGNVSSNTNYGVFAYIILKPSTVYTIRNMQTDFTWIKEEGKIGVTVASLDSYVSNADGTKTFTSPNSTGTKLFLTTYSANHTNAYVAEGDSIPDGISGTVVAIPNLKRDADNYIEELEQNIQVVKNYVTELTYTDGKYYATGYGDVGSNAALGIFSAVSLKKNTTYSIRAPYLSFTWLKPTGEVGVNINALSSFVDHADGTYTFKTPNKESTLYYTVGKANKDLAYLSESDYIPENASESGFVNIPKLGIYDNRGITLYVSKSYTASDAGYGVTKFSNVIDAINSITDSSEEKPYKVIIEAGTASTPIVYDEWNTVYGGHVPDGQSYVGIQIPSYVTITTTQPTHPDRTVLYFDGHSGISDTMTYNDAFKKCLFHIAGRKKGIVVEGVTLRSKDCRYAFHPESGVDGYGVEWTLKNCIIDWQGSPHSSETGWSGVTAVGVGLGYGGAGHFENCKWIDNEGVTTAIGGHTNGWNPGVSTLPTMPGATITVKSCDLGGYNVFMTNSTDTNELNNVLDFYNVVNCSGNDSTGWKEILQATSFD